MLPLHSTFYVIPLDVSEHAKLYNDWHFIHPTPRLSFFILNFPLIRISRVSLTSSLRLQFTSSFMHNRRHKKNSSFIFHRFTLHHPHSSPYSFGFCCGSGSHVDLMAHWRGLTRTRDPISIAINQTMMHACTRWEVEMSINLLKFTLYCDFSAY